MFSQMLSAWKQRYNAMTSGFQEHGFSALAFDWFIAQGYLWDWPVVIAAIVISQTVPVQAVPPVERFYSPSDGTLMYPAYYSEECKDASGTKHCPDPVPGDMLAFIMFGVPFIVIFLCWLVLFSLRDLHNALLSVLTTAAICTNFKMWMNVTGVLRPFWLNVVDKPNADLTFARSSFPSGHAAYSAMSMMWLCLYLLGKFRIMQKPGPGHLLKALLALSPLALSTYVACYRVARYMHSPADITCGMLIGWASAFFAYFIYFPSPWDRQCWQPTPRDSPLKASLVATHSLEKAMEVEHQLHKLHKISVVPAVEPSGPNPKFAFPDASASTTPFAATPYSTSATPYSSESTSRSLPA